MPPHPPAVRTIRTYIITPKPNPEAPHKIHMTAWDTAMLNFHYIQMGLVFKSPLGLTTEQAMERLKSSLEEALFHFYPLLGRLRFGTCEGGGVTCHVEVGGEGEGEGEGAEFVHAVADGIGIVDVVGLDGQDLPGFMKELFPLNLVGDYEGCTKPLLSAQVTMLTDGIFISCVMNHTIGDGTSFWNFFNAWAEIARCKAYGNEITLSRQPIHDRWFIEGHGKPPIKLPYSSPDEFVVRFVPPLLRERMFHFSRESLAKLKARANRECEGGTISTFQALSALMWRCITRARQFSPDETVTCHMAIQNRARLHPPLSPNYFGNSINVISTTTTVKELLNNTLSSAAWRTHQIIASHTNSSIREKVNEYMMKPSVFDLHAFDNHSIVMSSSPRFDMYGCDFGWGKALAARGGTANKFDGAICACPGWEGDGSIDLEVCLLPQNMCLLERDEEFLGVVSPQIELGVLLGTSSN